MSVVEAMAKAYAKADWHNDPERPFTDEVWGYQKDMYDRAVAAGEPDWLVETFYYAKCVRVSRELLCVLAESDLDDEIFDTCGMIYSSASGHHDIRHNFSAICRALANEGEPGGNKGHS